MAAVAVTADNTRVAVATQATDTGTWGNDGGGGGVADEPDIVYQGTTAQSRKVSGSAIGRSYTHGSGTDMTATGRRHYIAKINATNYAALDTRTTPGMRIKMGSASGAYYDYYLFGSDNYPARGGWQILAISPNVSGYRDATSGSPTLTSVLYWSIIASFTATSKAENLVIDAIDIGQGLKLTGGDGGDADGVFSDFLDTDAGTSSNRWGYIFADALDKIYFVNGELAIGENTSETAVATVFQDSSGQVLVWQNGLTETGFHKMRFNLGNATTDIDINGATFDSSGEANNTAGRSYTTTEDTRLTVEATGTSGALDLVGVTMPNCRLVTLTSACTLDTCLVNTPDLTQGSAHIFDSTIECNAATNTAVIDDPTFGTTSGLHGIRFVEVGAGHAIEITSPGTYTFTDLFFESFGGTPGTNSTPSSGASNAAVYNSSGGAVTINVSGGDSPSVRNAASSTTTVTASVTLTIAPLVAGSAITIADVTDQTVYYDLGSSGTSEGFAYNAASLGGEIVNVVIIEPGYEPYEVKNYTLPSTDASLNVSQITDDIYANP